MKLTTTFALASLCLVGTACSQAADSEEAQAVIATETAQIEDEYTGSLNLNLPSTTLSDDSTSTLCQVSYTQQWLLTNR